jgi:SAM-dependent methyltransferase
VSSFERKTSLVTGYNPARYGEVVGESYDALYPGVPAENEAAVTLLAELALQHPPVGLLEFGIGTGRLALGIARHGIRVAGIEGSERMLTQLRAKPNAEAITTVVGDYRDSRVEGAFSVVVLALNGIFDPRGRQAQLDMFRNAARHLAVGGYFVVESWVMHDAQRTGEWSVFPRYVGDEHVELQLARYDINTNKIERTLVHLLPEGMKFVTVSDTYASPGELDVMAEFTSFDRVDRYSNWNQSEFTSGSSQSISIYQMRE